ncbi:MAG: pyrroline-5-carboxylate reductase [Clostridia bacterium]|nr:pyrroline-5-carboxylate reductase [Clostridia bacterium]
MVLNGKSIGFIGAGAMAGALLSGLVKAKLVNPENLFASDIHKEQLERLASKLGINTCSANKELVGKVDIVLLAVKPQVMAEVLEEIRTVAKPDQLFISIAAGITITFLETFLASPVPVVRVMPNTPSLVGEGAAAIALGGHATQEHEGLATAIFGAVGKAVTVKENLLDSVTGLSGSGPAYVYIMLEALSDAGVRVGLPRDIATTLAAQTVLGAAKMVLETGEHPGKLKDMVTTPGGTTIAGLHALEEGGLRAALINGVMAAARRAQEMSSGQKQPNQRGWSITDMR